MLLAVVRCLVENRYRTNRPGEATGKVDLEPGSRRRSPAVTAGPAGKPTSQQTANDTAVGDANSVYLFCQNRRQSQKRPFRHLDAAFSVWAYVFL